MSDSLYTIHESYARYSLTDEAYEKIREYLPKEKTTGRPGIERLFLDALIFIVREGCSWRSIPAAYGKWNSIYKKFRSWESQNIFQRIYFCLMGLCDPNADGLVLVEQIYYAIFIDSTSNKAHQHAAGARKDAPESDVKQHIGTSRGGQNPKVHALVNDELEMVAFELTGGQVHDSKMAISLLEAANIASMQTWHMETRKYVNTLNHLKQIWRAPTSPMPKLFTNLTKDNIKGVTLWKDTFKS
ncbi:IS5 family transposase [Selenomonas ruminantium]|uniref:IS5 family transposase n=1 Tax=Selenomonas ruminantium TaxID=971 RepID=UPI0003FBB7AA|nr:IS5 family transposase [Selenomonas ruminantium]